MGLHTEELEGNPNKVAFLYGPLVLAGDLGPVPETPTYPYAKNQADNDRASSVAVPVLARNGNADLVASLKRLPGEAIAFRTDGIGRPGDVTLRPFNAIPYERYNVYWDVISAQDLKSREASLKAENERRQHEEARTVDDLSPGEQQSEIDHGLASERSQVGDFSDRKWRDAHDGGWFEFRMKVVRDAPQLLRCTYWGDEAGGREFDILIDGKLLTTQKLEHNKPGRFFDVETPIPAALLTGKEKITIRFQPHAGKIAGGLFHGAILKVSP
jgi:hypothetical protein